MKKDLSGNKFSRVWRDGYWIYKQQHAYFACNELWCFQQMYPSGYVPYAEGIDLFTIRTSYIPDESVTNAFVFMAHLPEVLDALAYAGIRHGDLTEYAIRVYKDKPYLIDFAESRLTCDPRSDKRSEGDAWWLEKTMEKLCHQ